MCRIVDGASVNQIFFHDKVSFFWAAGTFRGGDDDGVAVSTGGRPVNLDVSHQANVALHVGQVNLDSMDRKRIEKKAFIQCKRVVHKGGTTSMRTWG